MKLDGIYLEFSYNWELATVGPGALKAYAFAGPVFSLGLAATTVSYTKGYATSAGENIKVYDLEKINAYNGKYYNKVYNYSTEECDIEKKQSVNIKPLICLI